MDKTKEYGLHIREHLKGFILQNVLQSFDMVGT